MGTTATSGWALFWFLLGFTVLGTAGIGVGAFSVVGGIGFLIISGLLFRSARATEEA